MQGDRDQLLRAARAGDELAFRALIAPHERELRAHCYRMSGSLDQVDDLLQECLLRAWRSLPGFEGRASLRTWLYRVASSACIDALESKPMRRLATDLGPAADPDAPMPSPTAVDWVGPCPASLYEDERPDPEARYATRESVRLAFLAALQLLPARQRATLLGCDVLGWSAQECAESLGVSVPSVTSALQRARETLEERSRHWRPSAPTETTRRELLERYVHAWEHADLEALKSVLRDDATLSMPPLPIWLAGPDAIRRSIRGMVLPPGAAGMFRLLATEASGDPAFGAYRRTDAGFVPAALHVLTLSSAEDRPGVASITAFLDATVFRALGLPERLGLA